MTTSVLSLNYASIVFCAVASMVIGSIWYSPVLFGNAWIRMNGLTGMSKQDMMKDARKAYAVSLASALVLAYVLSVFANLLGITTVDEGIEMGVWLWAGLTASTMATNYAYTKRPVALLCIDAGYWGAVVLTMAGILAVWR
ncbi:hypothetical protein COU78_05325 [Candidatus Peregrinibacteria bacterium CG10_big_fil_rev_8_21_14_0_10_49_24]|nr:MAG: hypothetical protein COV83_01695 [Candidatus Peregrinibacteria bacterium CG11_big_fil_rev_8_21_14_0_20_49_14]PIR50766.1 MAG: hypothetical protein COU78_05325 [Candidatus Peregrinibacteria bacterium CG10_big_fil_rev_8_21_14_0_10_49_24]PJA68189.1 MAG: hypothetical protein CO157_00485 [Candidatus Peregrinibacteria bacterium CG_4_9_14_3_um_filter_49_12]